MQKLALLLSLFIALTQTTDAADAPATDVQVAVAANFTAPLEQIAAEFTKETGLKVSISSGSSGKFTAQIENGAPFDVFLSADQTYPKKLVEKKLAEPSSEFTYAIGALVLWSADPKLVDSAGKVLKAGKFKHIAIANPEVAPYGVAAREFLKEENLWDTLRPKMVMGESISQTQQFIASGNAELGFISLSQVKKDKTGSQWLVPAKFYSPILQDAVILTKSATKPAVKKFFEYLKGKKAKAVILDFGYTLPKK